MSTAKSASSRSNIWPRPGTPPRTRASRAQALAHASLFAALATLVRAHGEEATAELVAALPDRIRAGEYNLERQLQ